MAIQPSKFITPEEYLAQERQADHKSEYLNGTILAMVGTSRVHTLIVWNIPAPFLAAQPGRRLPEGCYRKWRRKRAFKNPIHPLLPRSPWLNACAERWVQSVKNEALSRMILFGERSLRHVLSE